MTSDVVIWWVLIQRVVECEDRLVMVIKCNCYGVTETQITTFLNFIFMLPCIVIDLFLNKQPNGTIIQIYSVIKLYMFRASSLSIIRSFLLYIRHWQVSCRFLMTASRQRQDGTQFHPDSAWKRSSKTCMNWNVSSPFSTQTSSCNVLLRNLQFSME